MYIDGTLVASDAAPTEKLTSINYQPSFGGRQNSVKTIDALIDNIAIWNIALSDEQILSEIDSELTGEESNLLGFWNFNTGQGNIVYDNSDNGNNGIFTNMDANAWWTEDIEGCTDPEACNYDASANVDDCNCGYGDCAGVCGGSLVNDLCGVCDGDNSTCVKVLDAEENQYGTVQIGNQLWMRQNLKTTVYNDESEIPKGHSYGDEGEWATTTEGAYAEYDTSASNYDYFGDYTDVVAKIIIIGS
jgi:hypothetical protein